MIILVCKVHVVLHALVNGTVFFFYCFIGEKYVMTIFGVLTFADQGMFHSFG